MKSFKILIFALLLFVVIEVKASSANLLVDCHNNEIVLGNELTCDVAIMYSDIDISSIEFNYQGNFDISFNALSAFSINNTDGKIIVDVINDLDAGMVDPVKIGTMIIKTNSTTNTGDNVIEFNSIRVKDNNNAINEVNDIHKTIKVISEEVKESDCNLLSITIDGVAISDFDPNKDRYEPIYVSKMVVFVDAVKSGKKASVTGLGNVLVRENTTVERKIHVIAEDGAFKDYYLIITNSKENNDENLLIPDTQETENSLKKLELYNGTKKLDFKFESSKTIYSIPINDTSISKLTIKAELNSNNASFVDEYGPRDINITDGDNLVEIKVKAQNGDVKTYKLTITKEKILSNENHLKSLKVNGNNIELIDDQLEYKIILANDILKTQIELETIDKDAKVEFTDIMLVDGVNEPIIIKVTSPSSNVLEYKIIVNRLSSKNEQYELNNIRIIGYNLKFDSSVHQYDLEIENDDKLNIILEPSGINHEIIGNKDLTDGSKVIIRILDENNTIDYIINIHKKEKADNGLIYFIFFSLSVLIFIGSIIYALKKGKNR